jgi:hypothetical protein
MKNPTKNKDVRKQRRIRQQQELKELEERVEAFVPVQYIDELMKG